MPTGALADALAHALANALTDALANALAHALANALSTALRRSAHRRGRTPPQVSARNETIQKLREELEEIKTGTVSTLGPPELALA